MEPKHEVIGDLVVDAVQRHLNRGIAAHNSRRIAVAFSGGMDSLVLLHCLSRLTLPGITLSAVHVNHHLHPDAKCWEQYCARQAKSLGYTFSVLQVQVPSDSKQSLEEAARCVRYQALQQYIQAGELLLTAHHANDQAETVLLQLLRGSGPRGLAAMPAAKPFAAGYLLRPLLEFSRRQIREYAEHYHLQWIDDPSNEDIRFDRNYIRHQVGAVLVARWPRWHSTIGRAARHQRSILEFMQQSGQALVARCSRDGKVLIIDDCLRLSDTEKALLLRHWLWQKDILPPNEKQMRHLLRTFLHVPSDAGGVVCWRGGEVRRYSGQLYAMTPLPAIPRNLEKQWKKNTDIDMPEIGQTLTWRQLLEQVPECADEETVTVRLRSGGEKCAYSGGRMHRPLKKIFQELRVPPWLRGRTPLIYVNDELRALWNLVVCH